MPITTVRKTRYVPYTDYIFTAVPQMVTTVYYISGPGTIKGMKMTSTSLTDFSFTITIDGVAQTSTLEYSYSRGSTQWVAPDLDFFTETPSECNISWSNEFILAINIPKNVTFQLSTHAQFEVEVDA